MPVRDGDLGGAWVRAGPEGVADSPRDFIPMKRFSTMSMRPTPCLPLWGERVTRSHRPGLDANPRGHLGAHLGYARPRHHLRCPQT